VELGKADRVVALGTVIVLVPALLSEVCGGELGVAMPRIEIVERGATQVLA
jgi:hypothetical protein